MPMMSKRARRRELRRLQAFERKHASELAMLRRLVESYRASARFAEDERDAVATKLRQLLEPPGPRDRCILPADDDVRFIVPVRFV